MSISSPASTPRVWNRALTSHGMPERRRRAGDIQGNSVEGPVFERRRRDGLGLLPPARTPEQRYRRDRANKVGGFFLVLLGSFVVGSSLALLSRQLGPEFGFSLTLGVLVLSQGMWLLGRRDRRRHDRQDRREQGRPKQDRQKPGR